MAEKGPVTREDARAFFERYYAPYEVGAQGKPGLLTGYYEPEIEGSREKTAKFQVPRLCAARRSRRRHARRDARQQRTTSSRPMRKTDDGLVPYYTREEIDGARSGIASSRSSISPIRSSSSSCRCKARGACGCPTGPWCGSAYAGKNGHPYTSIGKLLVERGEGKPGKLSMQGIKEWLREDIDRAKQLMWENRSYVFFDERPEADVALGPVGAQGVALTPERSIAVDPSYNALGTPVFVLAGSALRERDGSPFQRLMIAQDVGSAIQGPERGDIFFGSGDEAGERAGTTLVPGDFIVLKPKDAPGS